MKLALQIAALLPPFLVSPALADEQAGHAFFEKKVRPVLLTHCFSCHSMQAKKVRGGLQVDSRTALLKGGDSGPALVPGSPDKSLLVQVLLHGDAGNMPPKGKLPDAIIADLREWVKIGAPWPQEAATAGSNKSTNSPSVTAGDHWAFRTLKKAAPPTIKQSSLAWSDIDRFLVAGQEAAGVEAATLADRHTLIRRVTFDLTGLPPTPAEVDAFVGDRSPDAFAKVVDRLLASPHFGERWGRHWFDVVRYADSSGGGANMVLNHAWRYRDYVIAAFNRDRPFDRFLTEQIAGDQLPAADLDQSREQMIATGFLMLGALELAEYDKEKLRMDVIDEQIDTLGRAFLGLTLGCARCHDHKFDPIPTKDYYALAGIFRSTATISKTEANGIISLLAKRPLPLPPERARVRDEIRERLQKAEKELASARSDLKSAKADARKEAEAQVKAANENVRRIQQDFDRSNDYAMAVEDEKTPGDCRICIRGDAGNLGSQVPRGFLTAVDAPTTPIPSRQSGRLELARWMTRRDNPLTSRVYVNRVWRWLFGVGLVPTVDNFGIRGQLPTHPELLDFLAVRFMEDGWSTKKLIRAIVLSRSYQLSSTPQSRDPENRLFSCHQRRRLEAEEIRDAMMTASGQLDLAMSGPTHTHAGRLGVPDQGRPLNADPWRRRGIYLPVYRGGFVNDLFQVFDFPDSGLVTGSRNATTVPTQSLFLMNSPFVMDQAQHVAKRCIASPGTAATRMRSLYASLLSRAPTPGEERRAVQFLSDYATAYSRGKGSPEEAAWAALTHALMACNEFRYLD
jgi:cytochrome c553